MHRDNLYATMQLTMAAALAISMLTLGACQERKYNRYLHARDTITLSAGDAIAHNKAVQTIDPWPAHSRRAQHTTDGQRMVLGMQRYQKNESLEPQGLSTNNVYKDQDGPQGPAGGGGGAPAP